MLIVESKLELYQSSFVLVSIIEEGVVIFSAENYRVSRIKDYKKSLILRIKVSLTFKD